MIQATHLEQGSAAVAALCLMAGGLGLATSSLGAEQTPAIIAAVSPQEVQQWVTVIFDAANSEP